MPDRREGIARAEGFVAARIETSVDNFQWNFAVEHREINNIAL